MSVVIVQYKYPASCLEFQYDAGFPIRGLYYDKKKGFLLKLDFFHYVEPSGCFFGRRRVRLFNNSCMLTNIIGHCLLVLALQMLVFGKYRMT